MGDRIFCPISRSSFLTERVGYDTIKHESGSFFTVFRQESYIENESVSSAGEGLQSLEGG